MLYEVITNRLVQTQLESFALAFALVILSIGAMFRSLRLMAASIIPNVIPIVWTGGLMGFAGIELSTGTTMIASVVLGLAVDDRPYGGGPGMVMKAEPLLAAIHAAREAAPGTPLT